MDKLNVICLYYNFANYLKRSKLTREYIERMNKYDNINFYVVELALVNTDFVITDINNKNHLRLTTNTIMWYKENLINIAVNKLLNKNWSNFAWIDSDIIFENSDWVTQTLQKLQHVNIIQLFSKCYQLDITGKKILKENIGVIKYNINRTTYIQNYNDTHPGYGWAISREGYNKIGKIPDIFIVGGGDTRISYGMLGIDVYLERQDFNFTDDYKKYVYNLYDKVKLLTFDYIDCNIYHCYHGQRKDRKYHDRHKLLSEYNYNPITNLEYNSDGLLVPTSDFNVELLTKIKEYFFERKEDDEDEEYKEYKEEENK